MWQAQLRKERGGEVGLVAHLLVTHRLGQCAACPDEGDVIASGVGRRDVFRIADAVVGQKHQERVAPFGCAAQPLHEAADAVVKIGHGVSALVVGKFLKRHRPRFVARQREAHRKLWFAVGRRRDDVVEERVKHDAVRHAPGVRAAHFERKMRVAQNRLETRRAQIAFHLREIDVAAVEKLRGVARSDERGGNRGQAAAETRLLHHAEIGERGIAAQGAQRAAVGAEGIGIALRKQHALVCQSVEAGRNTRLAAETFDKRCAAAFHQYHHNIGAAGREQTVRAGIVAAKLQGIEQPCPLLFLKKVALGSVVLAGGKRGEEAESGIDGSVVQELVGAVIHHAHIGRTPSHAAANAEKE